MEKFRHTVAVQMGLLKPGDKISDLSEDKQERLKAIMKTVMKITGKEAKVKLGNTQIQEGVAKLQQLRKTAQSAGPHTETIEKLTFKLRLEQSELDKMKRKGNRNPAGADIKKRRIADLEERIRRLTDAAMLSSNENASEQDKAKITKHTGIIVAKRRGRVNISSKKVDDLVLYNTAVQLGFIKQGERLTEKSKANVQKVISATNKAEQKQGTSMMSDKIYSDVTTENDTPEIAALVLEYKAIHEKREKAKKTHGTQAKRRSLTNDANRLRKEIMRLRKVELAKKVAETGDEESKTRLRELDEERKNLLQANTANPSNLKWKKPFDERAAQIDAERDKLATKIVAVKMGLIKPGQTLDDKTAERVDKAVKEATRKTVLDKQTNKGMDKLKVIAATHVDDRLAMINVIEANEHGGDPLLKKLFDAYKQTATKRRAKAIEFEHKKEVDNSIKQYRYKVTLKIIKKDIKELDLQLRKILDGCLVVTRNNAINAGQTKTEGEQPKDDVTKLDESLEQTGDKEGGGDTAKVEVKTEQPTTGPKTEPVKLEPIMKQPTFEELMDDDLSKKHSAHSMAVHMGYIQPGEKLPAHVNKLMKTVLKTAKIPSTDTATLKSLGEDLAEKYRSVGEDDEIIQSLLKQQAEVVKQRKEVKKKGRKSHQERNALKIRLQAIEKQIRDRKKILLVQKHGFKDDPKGLEKFMEAVRLKQQAEAKKEEIVGIGTDKEALEGVNAFIDERDEYIDAVIHKKMSKMLGLSADGTSMDKGGKDELKTAMRKIDRQAFIALQTDKFKKTAAYKRLQKKYSSGVYSEVLQKRIERGDIKHDTELVGDSQSDFDDAMLGLKLTSVGAKLVQSGVKLGKTDGNEDAINVAASAFAPIRGVAVAAYRTLEAINDFEVNNGRTYDKVHTLVRVLHGYSNAAKSALVTASAAKNFIENGSGDAVGDVVPILGIVSSVLKISGGAMQLGKSIKARKKSKEELKNYEDGYNSGKSDDVDSFEILTLINMASKKNTATGALDVATGALSGAAYGMAVGGAATAGVGAIIAGVLKGISTILKVGKFFYKHHIDKKGNRKLIQGVLSEEEAAEFTENSGFQALTKAKQEKVITQSVGAKNRKHFVNMLRISHAMDLKERIDQDKLTARDRRLLRIAGMNFKDSETDKLKNLSVHELAMLLGFTGDNWRDSYMSVQEQQKQKKEKKAGKKMKEIREIMAKSTLKGFEFHSA